ncbi:MAG: secretin and TonB N-terminal domain-containing protein, partial [Deltaproteobacteria bacterium]|nr:secretin and TonB N-terminal domain-containing protein [Deltaproteobacteria bacterium]
MILSSVRMRKIFLKIPAIALVLLGGAVAGVVIGCSAMSIEEEKTAQAATPQAAPPQAQAQQKPQPPASVKEATLQDQPFNIQQLSVGEERGQTTLRVKFSAPVTQYRHFTLTLPSRVVLDVYGEAKRLARTETFNVNTHWLATTRVSSSEGYLRVVMDVTAGTVPAYVVEPENGGLKIVIGPVNPQHTAKKELQLIQGGKRTDVQVAGAKAGVAEAGAQSASAQTAATGEKKYAGQRISLDFKDADIKNVFRLLAEVSGLNIVVTDDVARKVTIRLVDVPWDQALDLLIQTNGLDKESVGNVVRISTAARLKTESDQRAAAKKSKENEESVQTAYFSINYAKVKDLVDKVKPALSKHPEASLVADDRSNTIIVRDIKRGIDDANAVVSKLDTRTAQVLIESNLIETTPTFARALGIKLNFDAPIHNNTVDDRSVQLRTDFPAGSPAGATPFFSIIQDRFGAFRNLSAQLSAAETEGNIKIISRPSVVTLNNVKSNISSLRVLRITLPTSTNIASGTGAAAGAAVATERVNVGITLGVTPQVSSDGFVLMNIEVKSSS